MKSLEDCPLVCVHWNDACSSSGWATEMVQTASVHTVGRMISEDKERIVIAGSIDVTNQTFGDQTAIPRSCVSKIKRLKMPR